MAKKKRSSKKPALVDLVKAIDKRCKSSNIKTESGVDDDGDDYVRVNMPNGRESRSLYLYQRERLEKIVASSFESYIYLGDYVAIASYEKNYIEAVILSQSIGPRGKFASIFGVDDTEEDKEPISITNSVSNSNTSIAVSEASNDMIALMIGPRFLRDRSPWTIKISDVDISTHDSALSIMESIANSLFFQIDLARNVVLSLRREPRRQRVIGAPHRAQLDKPEIEFPKVEYDAAPVTLYWYARASSSMPLLQFLAYYQCLEFYYPTYAQSEARRRIGNVLKNPTFRADRDADLTKVLSAAAVGPRGLPDERAMLRATIRECVGEQQLRDWFEATEERVKHFSAKTKGISDLKIPIANTTADLRDDVADRVYDIRCKIVHTKTITGDDSMEMLLPYSKEEQLIIHDNMLLRFLAQHVLISGSSPLKI